LRLGRIFPDRQIAPINRRRKRGVKGKAVGSEVLLTATYLWICPGIDGEESIFCYILEDCGNRGTRTRLDVAGLGGGKTDQEGKGEPRKSTKTPPFNTGGTREESNGQGKGRQNEKETKVQDGEVKGKELGI
jgi:hypothetical protein